MTEHAPNKANSNLPWQGLAYCHETLADRPMPEALQALADLGYSGVEFAPHVWMQDCTPNGQATFDQQAIQQAAQCMQSLGLQTVGLHWLLAHTKGLHLTDPNPAVGQALHAHVMQLLDINETLGGRVLVWGSPQQRSLLPGATLPDALNIAAERLHPLAEAAHARGMVIAFEPLSPKETNVVNTAQDGAALVQAVNHPGLQLHLDCKAMAQQSVTDRLPNPGDGQSIADRMAAQFKHLAHVHLNDISARGPGDGDTNILPVLQTLKDKAYTGWLSVEVFDFGYTTPPDWLQVAKDSMEHIRDCMQQLA